MKKCVNLYIFPCLFLFIVFNVSGQNQEAVIKGKVNTTTTFTEDTRVKFSGTYQTEAAVDAAGGVEIKAEPGTKITVELMRNQYSPMNINGIQASNYGIIDFSNSQVTVKDEDGDYRSSMITGALCHATGVMKFGEGLDIKALYSGFSSDTPSGRAQAVSLWGTDGAMVIGNNAKLYANGSSVIVKGGPNMPIIGEGSPMTIGDDLSAINVGGTTFENWNGDANGLHKGIYIHYPGLMTIGRNAYVATYAHPDSEGNYGIMATGKSKNLVMGSHATIETDSKNSAALVVAYEETEAEIDDHLTLNTLGERSYGVYTLTQSKVTIKDYAIISTAGDIAHGICANNSSEQNFGKNTQITTRGVNAFGIYSSNESVVNTGEGLAIITEGNEAYGIYVSVKGEVNTKGLTITTGTGTDSYLIYATDEGKVSSEGVLTLNGDIYTEEDGTISLTMKEGSHWQGIAATDADAPGKSVITVSGNSSVWDVPSFTSVYSLTINDNAGLNLLIDNATQEGCIYVEDQLTVETSVFNIDRWEENAVLLVSPSISANLNNIRLKIAGNAAASNQRIRLVEWNGEEALQLYTDNPVNPPVPSETYTVLIDASDFFVVSPRNGLYDVEKGDDLRIEFRVDAWGNNTKEDIIFEIDGQTAEYRNAGNSNLFYYILRNIQQDHTVVIRINEKKDPQEPDPNPDPDPDDKWPPELPTDPDPNPNPWIMLHPVEPTCLSDKEINIPFTKTTSDGLWYAIAFTEEAHTAGLKDISVYSVLPKEGVIHIGQQQINSAGTYTGYIVLKNMETDEISYAAFRVTVRANVSILSQPEPMISGCEGDLFELNVATDGDVVAYHWYHNGKIITGASGATYEGIINEESAGEYYVIAEGTCNSVKSQPVTVSVNGFAIQKKWNDLLYVDNTDGRYIRFEWYKNGERILKYGDAVYYTDEKGLEGVYSVRAYTSEGSYEESCPVIMGTDTRSVMQPTVSPSPVDRSNAFVLNLGNSPADALSEAVVQMYDVSGKVILPATRINGNRLEMTAPVQPGVYVIHIAYKEGRIKTLKLLVK